MQRKRQARRSLPRRKLRRLEMHGTAQTQPIRRPRYLLVLRHRGDLETFRDYLVPPSREVIQLLGSDEIALAFVQRRARREGAPHHAGR